MDLVVGGSGILGRALVPQLRASERRVRIMTRDPDKCRPSDSSVEVVRGDLLDEESVMSACDGVDTIIASVQSLLGVGRYRSASVDGDGMERLIRIARARGVARFLYLSVHGARVDHPIDFWRTKARIERILRESGLSHVTLRPTAFMELHADQLVGDPVRQGKRVPLIGSGANPRNFVAAEDVARVALRVLDDETIQGETIDVGGPENPTTLEVVRLYEEVVHRPARVLPLPLRVARAIAWAARPFHEGVSRALSTAVVAETTPQTFDCAPMIERFGVRPRSLREFLTRPD
jgi:uncharacterized protein YbjT (DUF2867 family)